MKSKIEKLGKVSITIEKDYWDKNKAYNRLTIVERQGTSTAYLSRKVVPIGIDITDRNYWITISKWADIPYEIVQEFGDSSEVVISQKVVTLKVNELQELINNINDIIGEGGSIDERITNAILSFKNVLVDGASEEGNTFKKIEDRLSDVEESVGEGGSVDDRIAVGVNIEKNRAQAAEELLREAYESLSQSQVIPKTAEEWAAMTSWEEGVIYRVAGTTNYTDYMYNGITRIPMAVYNNAIDEKPTVGSNNLVKSGGVQDEIALGTIYDVSAHNGSTTFESLDALLSDANLNVLIPVSIRKGGMSIKFIQSSDNKYVQYRLTNQNWSIDVNDWTSGDGEFLTGEKVSEIGVDDVPITNSNNLVKSSGVYDLINSLGIQNIDKSGYYVTDNNGNIVIQYNVNGFDVASVSSHFKTLINYDIEQTAKDFGYKSVADVLNHLLTMESVKEPSYIPELSELENTLLADTISRIAEVNPTGKYFTFGVITDLHQCKEGVPYGGGHVVTSEPSIRLLGAVAQKAKLDCVLCGGDLSTGGDLTFDEYYQQMEVVRSLFQKYINTPYYFTEGNHDKRYNSEVETRTNEALLEFFKRCNWMTNKAELHYFETTDGLTPNTYYIDFPDKKVRVIMVSSYEKIGDSVAGGGSAPLFQCLFDALQFEEDKCEEWSVVSLSHCDSQSNRIENYFRAFLSGTTVGKGATSDQHTFPNFNDGKKGFAVFGELAGHLHNSSRTEITSGNYTFWNIHVANAFCTLNSELTSDSYCFSIFVADVDAMKMYELRIGRGGETYTYDITHNIINE